MVWVRHGLGGGGGGATVDSRYLSDFVWGG